MAEYGDTVDKNFMIFTFGGKEHLYISMDENTRKSMRKVLGFCKKYNRDINAVLGDVALEWVKEAAKQEKAAVAGVREESSSTSEVTGAAL